MKYIHTRNFYKNRKCSQLKAVYLFTYIQESVNIRYYILIYMIVLTCICQYQIFKSHVSDFCASQSIAFVLYSKSRLSLIQMDLAHFHNDNYYPLKAFFLMNQNLVLTITSA